ncbi:hypothetical protein C2S52_013544 [Perilla frutescens var. hirtella]|nr:hypothetical protein C2S52_013544 [Perilla frutescens var. hirtella]
MESQILLAFLLFVPLLLFFLIKKKRYSKRLPPGSLGMPIIGQNLEFLRAMRANRGEVWLQERARKYGPISKMNIFGNPTVFLHGQAANKFIYTRDETTLSTQQPGSIRRLLGERNLFELKSEDHNRLRGAMLSFLKPDALKQNVVKMDQEIKLHLTQHWNHNKEIAVMPLMKTLTFNVICTLIFGVERGARRDTLVHLFEQVMDGMLVLPINLPFTRFNRSLGARLKAGGIIKELIHEKREKMKNNHEISSDQDLITSLLSICDEAGSPLLTDDEIEDNCAVAMIAGHDTTSTLLTFLIKLLAEHPHVYELVLNEQEEIARGKKKSGDPLMWDDLAKMKYTWRVATEALRMYPPVMFSFRQVLKDIEMEGYVIPKGWQVFWAGCMTQLDESIYPDPYKFNPSRYEKHGATPPHTFVAFGGGARTCPGNEFARIETLTMIHYLVTGFNWKLCLEENIMSRDPMPAFNQGLPIQIQIKKPWNRTVSPIP